MPIPLPGPGLLRLIFALAVVESHYRAYGAWNPCDAIAVYGFFFLSGYWIDRLYRAKYAFARRPVATFYLSRAWRIWPIAVTGILLGAAIHHAGLARIAREALLIGTAGRWVDLLDPPLWSIDVELQLYVVAPILVMLLADRVAAAVVLVIGLCGAYALARQFGPPTLLSGLLFFSLGMLFSQTDRPRRLAPWAALGIAAIAGTIAVADGTGLIAPGRLLNVAMSLLFLPCVALTLRRRSGRADRVLGDLTYPLYALHFPLRAVGNALYPASPVLAGLVLTGVAVAVVYLLIDRPLEGLRRRFVEARITRRQPAPAGMPTRVNV